MIDEVKTLAEWLLDPTTIPGDEFEQPSGHAVPACIAVTASGGLSYGPSLRELRSEWRRRTPDLTKLTAQQALDRGILVRP